MSHEGRALISQLPDKAGATMPHRDGECAAGTVYGYGDKRLRKPIDGEDREALRRLVSAGKMILRQDGNFGTASKALITRDVANRLKARDLAVSAFDKKTIFPSDKGLRACAEIGDAS